MGQRLFVQGNEAVGWGALQAGCHCFFGYPITPQNEVIEWFAREFPRRGKVFLQSQSESGSIYMLLGAGASGARAMTSTSSPGWSLMQDGMSCMATAEIPCVIVLVQRGGPGMGHVRQAQSDYRSVTKGGGNGGYRNIVLAPASVQETHDLVQLAFHLADKYRSPVIVLSDALMGQLAEPLEVETLEFGPLPPKDWAIIGKARHDDGKRRLVCCSTGPNHPSGNDYLGFLEHLAGKYGRIGESEVRWQGHQLEDAELVLVAYGYCARVCLEAVQQARAQGLKAGLVRPITLWPFPTQLLREHARQGRQFLVVEDSLGQLLEDVEAAVQGQTPVRLLGALSRHQRDDGGKIFPNAVLEEVRRLLAVRV